MADRTRRELSRVIFWILLPRLEPTKAADMESLLVRGGGD